MPTPPHCPETRAPAEPSLTGTGERGGSVNGGLDVIHLPYGSAAAAGGWARLVRPPLRRSRRPRFQRSRSRATGSSTRAESGFTTASRSSSRSRGPTTRPTRPPPPAPRRQVAARTIYGDLLVLDEAIGVVLGAGQWPDWFNRTAPVDTWREVRDAFVGEVEAWEWALVDGAYSNFARRGAPRAARRGDRPRRPRCARPAQAGRGAGPRNRASLLRSGAGAQALRPGDPEATGPVRRLSA